MRYGLASLSALVGALAFPGVALAATGDIRFQGCVTGASAITGCTQVPGATANGLNTGLGNINSAVVSPDGAFVYGISGADIAPSTPG